MEIFRMQVRGVRHENVVSGDTDPHRSVEQRAARRTVRIALSARLSRDRHEIAADGQRPNRVIFCIGNDQFAGRGQVDWSGTGISEVGAIVTDIAGCEGNPCRCRNPALEKIPSADPCALDPI
jgi:hypothetical protein